MPLVVLACWLVLLLGQLWRRTVWAQSGAALNTLAARWGVPVVPVWGGYRLENGAARLVLRGGPWGVVGSLRRGATLVRLQGELSWQDLERLGLG